MAELLHLVLQAELTAEAVVVDKEAGIRRVLVIHLPHHRARVIVVVQEATVLLVAGAVQAQRVHQQLDQAALMEGQVLVQVLVEAA